MNLMVAGVLLYVVAQLFVGLAVSRGIRSESDYLLAGRRLGYPLAIFSIFATWFGAETCVGAAGAVYRNGLEGGTADPFGYSGCLLLMGLVFAAALWRKGLTTLADLFRARYSPGVERVVVLLMVPTSILWAAAQIRAFGQVLSVSSGWSLTLTISIAAAVVIVYTTSGGLLADATTDLIQGILLTLGLMVLLVAAVGALGGAAGAVRVLEGSRLDMFGLSKRPLLAVVEAWLVPIIGSVTAQELVSRVLATRSPIVARRSTLVATGVYLTVGLIPVTLGLLGAALAPDLADPEQVLPSLARTHLHGVLYVLFAGALVSAILSTVDSNLLSAASLVSHNLILPFLPGASEARKVRLARVGVVTAGLAAYGLAFSSAGVYQLVEDASAFGGAGVFVVMAFGLFTGFGGARTAHATLCVGMALQLAGTYFGLVPYPFTVSFAASLAVYLFVGAWETGRLRAVS